MKNVQFLLPFLFLGCMSEAKLAQKCAEKFPVVVKTVSDTIMVDSIRTLPSDVSMLPIVRTVVCPASPFPSKIEVDCPICSFQVDYRTRYVTKMVLDSANVFLLKDKFLVENRLRLKAELKIGILDKENLKLKSFKKSVIWLLITLVSGILIGLFLSNLKVPNMSFLVEAMKSIFVPKKKN